MSRALQDYCSAFDDVFLHLPGGVRRRSEAEIDAMGLNDFKQAVAKMILCETRARLAPLAGWWPAAWSTH